MPFSYCDLSQNLTPAFVLSVSCLLLTLDLYFVSPVLGVLGPH